MSFTWTNVGVAFGWAAAAAVAAWLVTWPVRGRSFGWLMLSVSLTGTAASAGALLGAARSMLLPTGDEPQLIVLTAVAGLLALAGAVLAARRVGREHRVVGAAVMELGRGRVPSRPEPGLSRDITALQQQVMDTAAALNDARVRERALEASRRELVAWVSHDLRTPLAGLRAMAEALEDGVADSPDVYYKQISASVQRLSAMVDDLFDLSRIQAGALVRGSDPVDLADLVRDCQSALRPLADAKEIMLGVRLADETAIVGGTAAELARALTNVVANAIRHTPPGGRVGVCLQVDSDRHAEIVVADECGGIPSHVLPRVFEVGFRGSEARTPDDGRAGLGLAIARGVVEAHGGSLSVENASGGCRFRILAPLLQR